jgi:hypothetical protein
MMIGLFPPCPLMDGWMDDGDDDDAMMSVPMPKHIF